MRKLISRRHSIRQNIIAIIGLCLCAYFTYHAGFGTRSYFGLLDIKQQTRVLEARHATLQAEREALEKRVFSMRPDSLDADLLEEQTRVMLGYSRPDETIIIQTN